MASELHASRLVSISIGSYSMPEPGFCIVKFILFNFYMVLFSFFLFFSLCFWYYKIELCGLNIKEFTKFIFFLYALDFYIPWMVMTHLITAVIFPLAFYSLPTCRKVCTWKRRWIQYLPFLWIHIILSFFFFPIILLVIHFD